MYVESSLAVDLHHMLTVRANPVGSSVDLYGITADADIIYLVSLAVLLHLVLD